MTGEIRVIGLGPGNLEFLAPAARQALESADVILGYKTYLDLTAELALEIPRKSSGMRQEVERAQQAIQLAADGMSVAVISSGDPGVYGMAGLLYEVRKEAEMEEVDITVIPGISALNAAASLLGAPLMSDFAAVSLSDYLVPLETILQRLEFASRGDFVICIYNPKSRRRQKPFDLACQVLLKHRSPETPVGIVRSAYRSGQMVEIVMLQNLGKSEVDMLTMIIVGNSTTRVQDGVMITSRGYQLKYDLNIDADQHQGKGQPDD